MITIGKRFTFDAAHRLGRHDGKCAQPHGHTYILELDFTGPVEMRKNSSQGMVIDYYRIKEMVDGVVMQRFDHKDLNVEIRNLLPGDPDLDNVTTAENLVTVIAHLVIGWLFTNKFHGVSLTRARLQETPNSWAEWRP